MRSPIWSGDANVTAVVVHGSYVAGSHPNGPLVKVVDAANRCRRLTSEKDHGWHQPFPDPSRTSKHLAYRCRLVRFLQRIASTINTLFAMFWAVSSDDVFDEQTHDYCIDNASFSSKKRRRPLRKRRALTPPTLFDTAWRGRLQPRARLVVWNYLQTKSYCGAVISLLPAQKRKFDGWRVSSPLKIK